MDDHVDDLLPFYINATLPVEQRQAIEAHLAGCPQCQRLLVEWEELAVFVIRSRAHSPGQVESVLATGGLPPLSPALRLSLGEKSSLPEAILAAVHLIGAQRIYLKENRLIQTLCIVFLAGMLAGLFQPVKSTRLAEASFFILVPLLAVLGIGFLETPVDDPADKTAAASSTYPSQLIFARLTLTLGLIAGLALVGSLLIAGFGSLSPGRLVLAWLGPMLWLSALATLLALLINPLTAAGITAIFWGATALLLATEEYGRSLLGFSLAPLLYPSWQFFAMQALLACILWLTCWLWLFRGAPPALWRRVHSSPF